MIRENPTLAPRLADVHEAFSGYERAELVPAVDSCSLSLPGLRALADGLLSLDPDAITAVDLLDYYYLAVEHVGNADDLRRFLPKILEHVVCTPELLAPGHLPSLLRSAGFPRWPATEREAVTAFVRAASDAGLLGDAIASDVEQLARGALNE